MIESFDQRIHLKITFRIRQKSVHRKIKHTAALGKCKWKRFHNIGLHKQWKKDSKRLQRNREKLHCETSWRWSNTWIDQKQLLPETFSHNQFCQILWLEFCKFHSKPATMIRRGGYVNEKGSVNRTSFMLIPLTHMRQNRWLWRQKRAIWGQVFRERNDESLHAVDFLVHEWGVLAADADAKSYNGSSYYI